MAPREWARSTQVLSGGPHIKPLEGVLRGIAETMLADGTRRLTITCDTACGVDDLASIAHERWTRLAHVDRMTVRYIRCVETRWGIDGLIGGVFEAELEKA